MAYALLMCDLKKLTRLTFKAEVGQSLCLLVLKTLAHSA